MRRTIFEFYLTILKYKYLDDQHFFGKFSKTESKLYRFIDPKTPCILNFMKIAGAISEIQVNIIY